MMEFLFLYFAYLAVFAVLSFVCIWGNRPACRMGLIGVVQKLLLKVILGIIPSSLLQAGYHLIDWIFYTRNCTMQIIFGVLVLLGYAIVVIDVLPILYGLNLNGNQVNILMVVLFLNLMFFYICSNSDPGIITDRTHTMYESVYEHTGLIFQKKTVCWTCNFIKPARSKHCSICNRCIHRLDHHCVWTNNCIGALNHHYFLGFLLTLIIMCINGAAVSTSALVAIVTHKDILHALIMDDSGSLREITLSAIVQHLFLEFPRIVFLIASLSALVIILGWFFLYHFYLMCSNQTTNERSKLGHFTAKTTSQEAVHNRKKTKSNRNPYNCGILNNLSEVLFPLRHLNKLKKI